MRWLKKFPSCMMKLQSMFVIGHSCDSSGGKVAFTAKLDRSIEYIVVVY